MCSGKSELASIVTANNDDLLIDILARLPIKPLLPFKSVSKHCLSDRKSEQDYYIYNPSTKQFHNLPLPSARIHGVNKAYDPVKSPYYKVICVQGSYPLEEGRKDFLKFQIEIYSSETRSWRLSGDPFIANSFMQYENGVFSNGAVHWINCHDTSWYFNVDEEQLGEMPVAPTPAPDDWRFGRHFRYFGESRGHLHLIEFYGGGTIGFDVYEMERDYSRWFVKYRVDLDAITVAFPEMISGIVSPAHVYYYEFSILGIVREANDEESYMVLHIPGKAIRYKLNDNTLNEICDLGSSRHALGWVSLVPWIDAFQYTESLGYV